MFIVRSFLMLKAQKERNVNPLCAAPEQYAPSALLPLRTPFAPREQTHDLQSTSLTGFRAKVIVLEGAESSYRASKATKV